ncbi:hypothetical protein LTR37_013018 [Vermiconidia calcicola]|uniref:Uncharacterized protein n=1 Tax=Vermiconidia calcicola TaxID=1690605 RepID=A0ACC3MYB6_9PEZI|nr:hypothetical protein LTR37_013018 [Vermiconidia calcicola]
MPDPSPNLLGIPRELRVELLGHVLKQQGTIKVKQNMLLNMERRWRKEIDALRAPIRGPSCNSVLLTCHELNKSGVEVLWRRNTFGFENDKLLRNVDDVPYAWELGVLRHFPRLRELEIVVGGSAGLIPIDSRDLAIATIPQQTFDRLEFLKARHSWHGAVGGTVEIKDYAADIRSGLLDTCPTLFWEDRPQDTYSDGAATRLWYEARAAKYWNYGDKHQSSSSWYCQWSKWAVEWRRQLSAADPTKRPPRPFEELAETTATGEIRLRPLY